MYKFIGVKLFFLIILVSGCQSSNHEDIVVLTLDLPEFQSRTVERVPISGIDSFYASRLFLNEENLLIQEWVPYQKVHHVDFKNFNLNKSFGEKEGPYQFGRDLTGNGQITKINEETYSFFRSNKRGLYALSLTEFEQGQSGDLKIIPIKSPENIFIDKPYLVDPQNHNFSQQVSYFPDEQSTVKFFPDEEYSIIEKVPKDHIESSGVNNLIAANIFGNVTAFNTSAAELFVAYYYFNRVDIFDAELKLKNRIFFGKPKKTFPKLDNEGYPSDELNDFYFGHITSNTEKLCLLYFGEPLDFSLEKSLSKIIILDLNTLAVEGVKIDMQISHFNISEDGKELYFLSETDQYSQNLFRLKL